MFRNILKRPGTRDCYLGFDRFPRLPGHCAASCSQFPKIAPTVVNVFIFFPGASADVLTKSTVIPLEASINGVAGHALFGL